MKYYLSIFVLTSIFSIVLFFWEVSSMLSGGRIPFFRETSIESIITAVLCFAVSVAILEKNIDSV